jgi:hypothetical protein
MAAPLYVGGHLREGVFWNFLILDRVFGIFFFKRGMVFGFLEWDGCFCGVFLGLNVKVMVMYGWDDFWVLNGL